MNRIKLFFLLNGVFFNKLNGIFFNNINHHEKITRNQDSVNKIIQTSFMLKKSLVFIVRELITLDNPKKYEILNSKIPIKDELEYISKESSKIVL